MADYRVPEFTLGQRIDAGLQMLNPDREWGLVAGLSRRHNVSRTLLYEIRDDVRDAVLEALRPRDAGRPAQGTDLKVGKAFIDRTISVLPMLKGSVRDIQLGLELILGVSRSVGYISETLQAAGQKASAHHQGLKVPLPILGEADEIFQGRKPCLTVVDGRSFLALNLTPAESRDKTAWGVTYLDLVERGIEFQDLACDGAKGLRAGVDEAGLAIPLRPDLFHLMRDAHHLTARLERTAYKAIKTAERARQADLEARGVIRRPGPPLKVEISLPQAEQEEDQAIDAFDNCYWLLGEIRQALEPITPERHIVSVSEAEATIETALELLESIDHEEIQTFVDNFRKDLTDLLAPLEWLEQKMAPVLEDIDPETESFIVWAWQHRRELDLDINADIPLALRPVAHAIWGILELFHRSSSLAESLHSWLRPYLQIHRGMPEWLLPLLQLFWNYHDFKRGKRAGSSPLELAGVKDAPNLKEVLDQLFRPQPSAQPA